MFLKNGTIESLPLWAKSVIKTFVLPILVCIYHLSTLSNLSHKIVNSIEKAMFSYLRDGKEDLKGLI